MYLPAPRFGPDPSRVSTLDDLAREVGLLRCRAARGSHSARISLDEVARRVAEPKSTIHAYLTGKRLPPAEVLDRIVIALEATRAEQREWAEAWYRVSAAQETARRSTVGVAASGPRQLPLPVDRFTGRAAELAALDELLLGERPTSVVALSGTAGGGKTALALHWAHSRVDRFPDGQLYVDLRGYDPDRPLRTADAAARLLRALGLPDSALPRSLEERAASFRSVASGRRLLIVLDNARDTEHVRALLPGTPSCALLVTSRDSLAGLIARHGAQRIDLDVLPMADATELLRALIVPRGERDDVDLAALAEQCARLPLALRIAAEFAASHHGPSLRDMVDQLASGEQVLDLLDAGDDPRTALRAVFSWSYLRLSLRDARAFRLIALQPEAEITVPLLATLTGLERTDSARSVDVLTRAHLLREVRPDRYAMHNLLRSYGRELADPSDIGETTDPRSVAV